MNFFGRSILSAAMGLCLLGCQKAEVSPPPSTKASAYEQMLAFATAEQWDEAAKRIEQALIERPADPDVLENAARVATFSKQSGLAADLLLEASAITEHKVERRYRQAFLGLISAGRVFDAIALLEQVVEQQPDNVEMRKLLHSFLVATERHATAAKHAQQLVKQRQFDFELLHSLGDIDRRTKEADSLVEMTTRYPADLRPLIGKARYHFDNRVFAECIELLEKVIAQHPDDTVSLNMLGRSLVLSGQFDRLASWTKRLPNDIQQTADYWLTLGDWAWADNRQALALEAYARAAQLDPDQVQIWDKFAVALRQQDPEDHDLANVSDRAQWLTKLRQLHAEIKLTNEKDHVDYIEIAEVLMRLGRLWEAEAWLALGQTAVVQPAPTEQSIQQTRAKVVALLSRQTPWQTPVAVDRWSRPSLSESEVTAQITGTQSASLVRRTKDAAESISPELADEAETRGLQFFAAPAKDLNQPGVRIHETLGCGGAAIDFDLNGWPDLYLVTAGGIPPNDDSDPNALFRNLDGRFTNVSGPSQTDDRGFGQGVAVGDVNADGFDDLLILNYGLNRLLINQGDGTFVNGSQDWLADQTTPSWSTSAAIADLDGDSLSDVVIAKYCAGLEPSRIDCDSTEFAGHRACSPIYFPAEADLFLRNTTSGKLVNATQEWRALPVIPGRGLGVVVGTFTPGRVNDVYVVNDMTSNHYWSKDQAASKFQLVESAALYGLANDGSSRTQGSMGIATSDWNDDGIIDFFVTNFSNEYNTMYLSKGATYWSDDTLHLGLAAPSMSMVGFGTKAVDLDLNGSHELLVTNGHVDTFDNPKNKSPYAQPFQLYARDDTGRFQVIDLSIRAPYFARPHVGRTLFFADVNRDTKRDLVVTHQTEPVALLVNHTKSNNRSLNLRFAGTRSERNAIGTRVELRAGSHSFVTTITSGDGYLCSDERYVQWGLGESVNEVEVHVQWPSGSKDRFDLRCDSEWLLVEGEDAFALRGL